MSKTLLHPRADRRDARAAVLAGRAQEPQHDTIVFQYFEKSEQTPKGVLTRTVCEKINLTQILQDNARTLRDAINLKLEQIAKGGQL